VWFIQLDILCVLTRNIIQKLYTACFTMWQGLYIYTAGCFTVLIYYHIHKMQCNNGQWKTETINLNFNILCNSLFYVFLGVISLCHVSLPNGSLCCYMSPWQQKRTCYNWPSSYHLDHCFSCINLEWICWFRWLSTYQGPTVSKKK
jgi:hypothetical protein